MRVTHLSTFRTGGAGTAAWRLHRALRDSGMCESRFASLQETSSECGGVQISRHYPRWYHRLLSRVGVDLTETAKQRRSLARLDLKEASFSFPRSDIRLLEAFSTLETDIVNLHWVSGILDWPTFFRECDRPVVWTLHDMNPFLGGFHYTCDRERANTTSVEADARMIALKRSALSGMNNLTLVSPSFWLSEEAGRSELLSGYPSHVIPNGVDTKVFRQYNKDLARSLFNIPQNVPVLLTLAEDLRAYRKGCDVLLEALALSPLPKHWLVVSAGRGQLRIHGYRSMSFGSIQDERLLALLYSAVDMLVVPTRQDNLPNVVLESMACGTPVVATNVGGLPEAVDEGRTGCLAEKVGAYALSEALRRASRTDFDRDEIRCAAKTRFDIAVTARRYQEVYARIQSGTSGCR